MFETTPTSDLLGKLSNERETSQNPIQQSLIPVLGH